MRFLRDYFDLQPILVPICAILLAVFVGGIVILLVGENPFTAYWSLLRGMFGSWDRVAASLGRSTPFIGAALAVAFAFRAGLFNIGVEGQLLVGATAAAWVGTWDVVERHPRPARRRDGARRRRHRRRALRLRSPASSRCAPGPTR